MLIDFYDFGRIKIDGKFYERDVVIFPDRVFSPWIKKTGHYIDAEELSLIPDLLKDNPELVIIGTGYDGVMRVAPDVEEFFRTNPVRNEVSNGTKGIEVIIQKTIDAWKTYNETSKNKKVVALFHLTC